jgi:hypothetical protein
MFSIECHCIVSKNGRIVGADFDSLHFSMQSAADSGKPILIWFHGGLVSTTAGKEVAKFVGGRYHTKSANVYPLFFLWESGPTTAIYDAVVALLRRKLGQGAIDILTKMLRLKLSLPPIFGAEGVDPYELTEAEKEILKEVAATHPDMQAEAMHFAMGAQSLGLEGVVNGNVQKPDRALEKRIDDYLKTKKAEVEAEEKRKPAEERDLNFDLGGWLAKVIGQFLIEVAIAVLGRYRSKRNHDLKETIIEEAMRIFALGGETWTQIKRDVEAAFDDDPNAVGRVFAAELKKVLENDPGRRVILAGHSAGSIYVCHLLEELDRVGFAGKVDVRFLAAAARFDLVEDTFKRYGHLIGDMRSFALTDQQEQDEALLAGAPYVGSIPLLKNMYMGSLLYLVSGCFEAEPDCPIFGMQRFVDKRPALNPEEVKVIDSANKFVRDRNANGFVWSGVANPGGTGFACTSTSHGGFDEDWTCIDNVLV